MNLGQLKAFLSTVQLDDKTPVVIPARDHSFLEAYCRVDVATVEEDGTLTESADQTGANVLIFTS